MHKAAIQAFVEEEFKDKDQWGSFHDCVINAHGGPPWKNFSVEELKEIFIGLSPETQGTAIQWGLSDTVFRDAAFVEIRDSLSEKEVVPAGHSLQYPSSTRLTIQEGS